MDSSLQDALLKPAGRGRGRGQVESPQAVGFASIGRGRGRGLVEDVGTSCKQVATESVGRGRGGRLVTDVDAPSKECCTQSIGRGRGHGFILDVNTTSNQPETACTQASFLVWDGSPLPEWSYDRTCAEKLARVRQSNTSSDEALAFLQFASAPAWRYAFGAVIILWTFWALCPFGAYAAASCNGRGLAKSSGWILPVYMPILICSIIFEVKCHSFTLPWVARYLGGDTFLGVKVSFKTWLAIMLSQSFIGHLDLATTGDFFGRLLRTEQCPQSEVDIYWNMVTKQSLLTHLPSLVSLMSFCWLAMVLQLVWALACSVPIRQPQRRFKTVCDLLRTTEPSPASISALFGDCVTVERALEPLTEASRMVLVGARQVAIRKITQVPFLKTSAGSRREFAIEITKLAVRVPLTLLLENSIITNIQSSCLAVTRAATGDFDSMTTFSIMVGFLTGIMNWTKKSLLLRDLVKGVWPHLDSQPGQFVAHNAEDCSTDELDAEAKRHIKFAVTFYTVSAALSITLYLYAVVKTVMVYVCDKGAWNLSGCVTID